MSHPTIRRGERAFARKTTGRDGAATALASPILTVILTIVAAALAPPAAAATSAPVDPAALYFDRGVQPGPYVAKSQLHCLALNIYHEARGDGEEGMLAVATVTMNRVRSGRFPNSICGVVWQRGQFSWTQDGRSDRPYELSSWRRVLHLASLVYWYGHASDIGNATFYHRKGVRPRWAREKRLVGNVGRHLFYATRET